MKSERIILAYKNYFKDFIQSLNDAEARKVFYVIDMLKTQERVNAKFVKYLRDEIFELRAEQGGNIFRVFFIFDDGNVVMLFNGFQKKSQKTPEKEINKAYISRVENGSVEPGAGMFLRILNALGLRFEVSQPLAFG